MCKCICLLLMRFCFRVTGEPETRRRTAVPPMLMARKGKPYLLVHCQYFWAQLCNTRLQWPHVLIWLGYEIVFSLANHTIDNSILFSQLYSAAQRCVRKLRPRSTMGLRVMCEMKRHLESACGQMQVPHGKKNRCSSRGESFCCMKNTPC